MSLFGTAAHSPKMRKPLGHSMHSFHSVSDDRGMCVWVLQLTIEVESADREAWCMKRKEFPLAMSAPGARGE